MFKKLLALGAAGIAAAFSTVSAYAWMGGFGCGCGCGCGGLGWPAVLGFMGPASIYGWPWGLFGRTCCW